MKQWREFAVNLAHRAGTLLRKKLRKKNEIYYKGEINLVTEADKMSEDLIIAQISKNFPGHGIMSEESPAKNSAAEFNWIIDPLDGTTNYAHGYPVYCVSIALAKAGSVILGVVYDPARRDTFTAIRGGGAFLNDKKIAVSLTGELDRSLLATGFPYDIRQSKENNLDNFSAMATKAQAIRRAGAAALDISYVAAGRFDGFWELKLMPWDTAAACLILEEAGGKITDIRGGRWDLFSPHIVASNGNIHEQMLNILKK